jgi:hypothetical protein
MGDEGQNFDSCLRCRNGMTAKRLFAGLLGCALLVLAGVFVYLRLIRKESPPPKVVTNWPVIAPSKPLEKPPVATPSPETPPPSEPPVKKETPAEPGFVLRQGETLEYAANVPKLNSTVANLKIVATEKRSGGEKGSGSWHLQAFAHTENPYRMVFELDDEFDSYSEAGNMTGVQYEMHLSERGQKVDNVERLLSSPDPPPVGTSAARVLPGTRDPLGMLEYLRGVDWAKTPEVHSPVYDGRKLYDLRAVLVGKSETVSVPAGSFKTIKIEIHVIDNGVESKDAHFLLYLTNDSARLPVLMEAVLPVATARVELTKAR